MQHIVIFPLFCQNANRMFYSNKERELEIEATSNKEK